MVAEIFCKHERGFHWTGNQEIEEVWEFCLWSGTCDLTFMCNLLSCIFKVTTYLEKLGN